MSGAFERTVCACDDCRACCKRQPGPLGVGDLQRIARIVDEPDGKFVASNGAVVEDRSGQRFRIRTITPARKPDGSCVFLDADERCTIHGDAPLGCAYFDTHMSAAEGGRRSVARHAEIASSPEYQMQRNALAGKMEPLVERL